MLDFNKLMQQIDQVGRDSLDESLEEHETLLNAQEAYEQAAAAAEEFARRLADNRDLVFGRCLCRWNGSVIATK